MSADKSRNDHERPVVPDALPVVGFRRPRMFGILNITADSFSDGGRFLAPGAAIAHARGLIEAGAFAIDAGGASSNPDAAAIAPDVEIARLAPVVEVLQAEKIPISIDSFSLPVQRWALAQQVDYLNDIQGFSDPVFYRELAESRALLIVMHSVQRRGKATRVHVPATKILDEIRRFFDARIAALTDAGVDRARLILDPGMGFFLGADPQASVKTLRGLQQLRAEYCLPLFVSVSRKSFLRTLVQRSVADSGAATLAAELHLVRAGVDFIRTHDVRALGDALKVWASLS